MLSNVTFEVIGAIYMPKLSILYHKYLAIMRINRLGDSMKPIMILFVVSLIVMQTALAVQPNDLHYNLVSLQESVEIEVENDVMHARVVVQHVNKHAKDVAKLINADMKWALAQVKKHKAVKAQTLNYSTYPQYDNRKIKSWTGRQEMSLESQDFDLLTRLIGDLQARLQVSNIRFAVSPKKYKQTEDGLIADAVKVFNKKAKLIAGAMDKAGFIVVNMNVNTNRQYAQPIARKSSRMEMMSADIASEPAVVAGTNTVRVNVSGQIQTQ